MAEERAREVAEEKATIARIERRGIPAKYHNAEMKNCDPNNPAVAAVMRWVKKPTGIILVYGDCGRGKTYLAAAAKKELCRNLKGGDFVCEDEIFQQIKGTFDHEATMTEREAYKKFTKRDPLIIDDVGCSRPTDFTFEVWETIIGRRYREECPTMITTNLDPERLRKFLGDRVFDRIRESKLMFRYDGKNRREA